MSLSCPYSEAHFCSLSSQSNVYGLAKLNLTNHANKLFAAPLSGKIICLDYCSVKSDLTPVSREVQFSYIPQGYAEIVSIDAFTKYHGNGVVVGVTFIKDSGDKLSQFLNIYSDWEPGSDFNLDELAQSCQSLELPYIPYQLTHYRFVENGVNEVVFLLSGNDCRVHMFREDKTTHTFGEQSVYDFFPEFVSPLPGCPHWIDIKSFSDSKRVTAVACDNFVVCFLVDTDTTEIINSWKIEHGGYVTSLKLFTSVNNVNIQLVDMHSSMSDSFEQDSGDLNYHLLVTGALEVDVVYVNILTHGFSHQVVLPDSDSYDCTMCCCVCDIDLDGQNEIVLGTFGQVLLAYKYYENEEKSEATDSSHGEYRMLWQRSFSNPILAIDKIDITGDGLKEFAVLSSKGLHILQHNLEEVVPLCLEKLKTWSNQFIPKEDPFQQLLSETFTDHERELKTPSEG